MFSSIVFVNKVHKKIRIHLEDKNIFSFTVVYTKKEPQKKLRPLLKLYENCGYTDMQMYFISR